jgi:hypothetical protein
LKLAIRAIDAIEGDLSDGLVRLYQSDKEAFVERVLAVVLQWRWGDVDKPEIPPEIGNRVRCHPAVRAAAPARRVSSFGAAGNSIVWPGINYATLSRSSRTLYCTSAVNVRAHIPEHLEGQTPPQPVHES